MTRALLFVIAAGCSASPKHESSAEPAATTTPSPAEGTPAQIPPSAPGTDPCPTMQVKAPDSVPAGTQIKITTSQVGGSTPSFKWSVTAGKIASGQGTPNIVVDSTGLAGSTIVANLELGSLPSTCVTTATSVHVLVGP